MKHKLTFLHQNKPLITCMVQARNPESMIDLIHGAVFDGCDAFGFQMEQLEPQYHNDETVKELFSHMAGRPIYATNYRVMHNEGKSDEEIGEGLIHLRELGATLIDVLGDLYSPAQYEITYDKAAIEKQKALIDRLHGMGAEVLMSSHVLKFKSGEEVLAIAREHQARGADISKIVTFAETEEEELENLKTTALLRRELEIPFLFLSGGTYCKLHRTVGPMLGACMWLTVQKHDECSSKFQPICRAVSTIANNLDYLY